MISGGTNRRTAVEGTPVIRKRKRRSEAGPMVGVSSTWMEVVRMYGSGTRKPFDAKAYYEGEAVRWVDAWVAFRDELMRQGYEHERVNAAAVQLVVGMMGMRAAQLGAYAMKEERT